ncbi:MAG TPA: ROK family protein [Acidimicrobiales bacterium]|nr:ROK family protein [Acidimicrobiales bacterium]
MVAPDRPLVAGVDVGGTKILGRVLDPDDARRTLVEVRADTPRGADAIGAALVEVVGDLRAALERAGHGDLRAVGIGIAGLVDRGGVLRFAPNLPGVVGFDVGAALRAATGLAVVVDNDANCATVAEHRVGAGSGADDLVLVTLGTGIGGGLIAGGALQRGAAGFAGEPGHMVVDPHGPPCPCGRRGCWERYASGSGLGRLARDAAHAGRADAIVALAGGDPEEVRGEHVTSAAADGDPDALAVLREFAWWVALGVSNLENVLDPEVVVIGGGLADAGELLLGPTREAYATLVLGYEYRPPVRIVAAALGADAGAIGAGLRARDLLDA